MPFLKKNLNITINKDGGRIFEVRPKDPNAPGNVPVRSQIDGKPSFEFRLTNPGGAAAKRNPSGDPEAHRRVGKEAGESAARIARHAQGDETDGRTPRPSRPSGSRREPTAATSRGSPCWSNAPSRSCFLGFPTPTGYSCFGSPFSGLPLLFQRPPLILLPLMSLRPRPLLPRHPQRHLLNGREKQRPQSVPHEYKEPAAAVGYLETVLLLVALLSAAGAAAASVPAAGRLLFFLGLLRLLGDLQHAHFRQVKGLRPSCQRSSFCSTIMRSPRVSTLRERASWVLAAQTFIDRHDFNRSFSRPREYAAGMIECDDGTDKSGPGRENKSRVDS